MEVGLQVVEKPTRSGVPKTAVGTMEAIMVAVGRVGRSAIVGRGWKRIMVGSRFSKFEIWAEIWAEVPLLTFIFEFYETVSLENEEVFRSKFSFCHVVPSR